MIRKWRHTAPVALACMVLGGCNLFPEPVSLISAPGEPQESSLEQENHIQTVMAHLPAGTSLYVPNEPVGSDSVIQADFNNDGKKEVIAFYKSTIKANEAGVIVLEKKGLSWEEIANFDGPGYEISWGSAEDITGDGRTDLLIGWKMGVSAGSMLDIYSWKDQHFEKIAQEKYHELDLLSAEGQSSLAIWQRELEDVYDVKVVKWKGGSFTEDQELTPAYFKQVAHYYQQRTEEVPDAAYYWYYLADSYLKADMPEDAQMALNQGMQRRIKIPDWNAFEVLRKKTDTSLSGKSGADVLFYDPQADLTMNIPDDLYPNITVEPEEGEANEYVLKVYFTEGKNRTLLFAIEVHSQEFIVREEFTLPVIAENEQLIYGVRRTVEDQKLDAVVDGIIGSVRLGSPFAKYEILEDQLLIKKVQEAYQKAVYVGMGGKMKDGMLENFPLNDTDYRYLGEDIDTLEKMNAFLGSIFTKENIQKYMETMRIVEHDGRLAQPNADGGSLLNYSKAKVLKVRNLGTEVQYDLSVPLGNSLVHETVTVIFKKTAEGWRISSNPVTL